MIFPRVLIGNRRLAFRSGDAVVVDVAGYRIYGLGLRRRMRQQEFRLLSALLLRAGGLVTYDELVDHIWGDHEDGGPLGTRHLIHIKILRLRHHLRRFRSSLSLEVQHGVGVRAVWSPPISIEALAA